MFLFSSVSHWQYRFLFSPLVLLLFHWSIGMGELISLGILKAGFCCKILGAITLIQLILSFCFAFEIGLLIGQTDLKLPMRLRMTLNRRFASPLQSWDFHFKFKFHPFKLSTSCLLILCWAMCVCYVNTLPSSIHNYSVCFLADFQSALERYFFDYEE